MAALLSNQPKYTRTEVQCLKGSMDGYRQKHKRTGYVLHGSF